MSQTAHPELEGLGKYEYGWSDKDVAGANHSATLTGLTANTHYQFQVATKCVGVSSAYSASYAFYTLVLRINALDEEIIDLKTYPNPASDKLTIELPQSTFDVALINIIGETVFDEKNVTEKIVLDADKFTRGIYFVRASTNKSVFTKKIILQ